MMTSPICPPTASADNRVRCLESGWGACCGDTSTGGSWSIEETAQYINYLELLAAFLVLKTFAINQMGTTLLKMENVSAASYINQKGGTHSTQLCNLALEIWKWCLERQISLQAEHLPGILNTIADTESRVMRKPVRLDDQPICIPTNPTVSGSFPNKPICIMADQVTDPFLQLETRPRSRGNRCLHTELGTSEGLCQPSLVSDLSLFEQSKKARSQTSDGDTSMAIPTMVPSTTQNAGGSSPTTSTDSRFNSEPHQSGVHNETGSAKPGHMAHLRESFAS